jgi:zinc protease
MKSYLTFCLALIIASAVPAAAAPLGTRTVLDNGAILLVAERPGVPMVVMTILLKTGATADPDDQAGLANLTGELLTRGTKQHSAQTLAEDLDFIGASLGVNTSYETTTISLTTLTKNLEPAFALFSEVLISPTFPEAEFDRKRKEIEGGLQSREEDPGWVARKLFLQTLYPHHPLGRLVEGQPNTLAALTRADTEKFHQTYYRPNNAIIALAGDISQEQAVKLIDTHLADWQPADMPTLTWPDSTQQPGERVVFDKKVSQANVILGHGGIARSNPDYYAVMVMNYILGGGGFGSRLMDRIREELGLAYSIYSSFTARNHPGPFTVGLQTKNASATQAIAETLQVMRRFLEQGPTEQELIAAKSYYINSFPLRLVSNRDVASLLPVIEFYGLGLDYPDRYADLIGQVTLEHVHTAAKTYLHPDRLLQVVVADLTQAELAPPAPAAHQPTAITDQP